MNQSKLAATQKELDAPILDGKLELALCPVRERKTPPEQGGEVDLKVYAGSAHLPVDALKWQRDVRAEWDR